MALAGKGLAKGSYCTFVNSLNIASASHVASLAERNPWRNIVSSANIHQRGLSVHVSLATDRGRSPLVVLPVTTSVSNVHSPLRV